MRRKSLLVGIAAAGLVWLVAASPAQAWYKFCNKTKAEVSVAFAYRENGEWVSEGWWSIKPGNCSTVHSEDLDQQKYYFYADSDESDNTWSGDSSFCTLEKKFTITGNTNCKSRGYKPRGFKEIDVGDSVDWTTNLTQE